MIASNRSLYLSIRSTIKQIAVIIGAYHFANNVQNIIQNPALKFNSICNGNDTDQHNLTFFLSHELQ